MSDLERRRLERSAGDGELERARSIAARERDAAIRDQELHRLADVFRATLRAADPCIRMIAIFGARRRAAAEWTVGNAIRFRDCTVTPRRPPVVIPLPLFSFQEPLDQPWSPSRPLRFFNAPPRPRP